MSELDVSRQLSDAVAKIIETRREAPTISPAWVATEVLLLEEFDPKQRAKRGQPLVYALAHAALRQIARGQLAKKFDVKKTKSSEPELFEGLQLRYPMAHGHDEEPRYILRDLLSETDIEWNIKRLRAEGQAKLDHADALEAWQLSRPIEARRPVDAPTDEDRPLT